MYRPIASYLGLCRVMLCDVINGKAIKMTAVLGETKTNTYNRHHARWLSNGTTTSKEGYYEYRRTNNDEKHWHPIDVAVVDDFR